MDQPEERGRSVALHKSWLIYFALSFRYLLDILFVPSITIAPGEYFVMVNLQEMTNPIGSDLILSLPPSVQEPRYNINISKTFIFDFLILMKVTLIQKQLQGGPFRLPSGPGRRC